MERMLSLQCLCLSFLSFCTLPHLSPEWRPIFFAPYLVANFYQNSRERVAIQALYLGIFCDIGSSYPLGTHAFLYTLTSFLLYRTHTIFLKDKWLSIPIIVIFFSWVFVFLSYPTLAFFNYPIHMNMRTCLSDIKQSVLMNFIHSVLIYLLPCIITRGILRIRNLFRSRSCY